MNAYGVDVTIVEFMDRLLPNEDEEVSKEIAKHYKKLGITLLTGHKTTSISDNGDSVEVEIESKDGEDTRTVTVDKVLMAVGFAPRVEGYGLENTGVELTDRGAIDIDDNMRTNVAGIYALGDVTAKLQLAHVAEAQGVVAAETLAGAETFPVNYDFIPRATYCQPQVGSMGYSEQQAKDKGYEVKVGKFPFSANGKAWGLGEGVGFVKLVADAKTNEILGAHMIGPDVTELLPEMVLAQQYELRADEIGRTVHAHPTLSEALKEAAEGVVGHMINF